MRFQPLTSILFVLLALCAIPSGPAMAARVCHCSSDHLLPSGTCPRYGNCQEVAEFAPTSSSFRPIRKDSDCRRSRVLVCDDTSCTIGCESQMKPAAKKK